MQPSQFKTQNKIAEKRIILMVCPIRNLEYRWLILVEVPPTLVIKKIEVLKRKIRGNRIYSEIQVSLNLIKIMRKPQRIIAITQLVLSWNS